MKIKPISFEKLILAKDFGYSIEGNLIFTNLDKRKLESISENEFNSEKKIVHEIELSRVGNPDDEEPNQYVDVCTTIEINDVKLDKIPLSDDMDLSIFDTDDADNIRTELKLEKTWEKNNKITIDRKDNDESFMETFFWGNVDIEPNKFNEKKHEFTTFDLTINGCHLHDNKEHKLDDLDRLIYYTMRTEFELENDMKFNKYSKSNKLLQQRIYDLENGKKKKIPSTLFPFFYSNINNKKRKFIVSLKDNQIFEIEN